MIMITCDRCGKDMQGILEVTNVTIEVMGTTHHLMLCQDCAALFAACSEHKATVTHRTDPIIDLTDLSREAPN
jgi:hypothetical protein